MKLFFDTKLITLTLVVFALILVVVFFIGVELGRLSSGLESGDMLSEQRRQANQIVDDATYGGNRPNLPVVESVKDQ